MVDVIGMEIDHEGQKDTFKLIPVVPWSFICWEDCYKVIDYRVVCVEKRYVILVSLVYRNWQIDYLV